MSRSGHEPPFGAGNRNRSTEVIRSTRWLGVLIEHQGLVTPNTTRRILNGVSLGALAEAVVGLVAGCLAGLIQGGKTIFLMGPLYVSRTVFALLSGALMLAVEPILGSLVGLISAKLCPALCCCGAPATGVGRSIVGFCRKQKVG
jgi:hypothetical protein